MAEKGEQHFVGKVAQKVVIEHRGKLLVCRDVGEEKWDIPGGRLNVGEHPTVGLARELEEELGVSVNIGEPFSVDTFTLKKKTKEGGPHLLICYKGTLAESDSIRHSVKEIEEIRWVSPEELDSIPLWEEYRGAIRKYLGN